MCVQALAGVMDGARNYTAKIEYLVKAKALSNNGYLHVETAHMRRYGRAVNGVLTATCASTQR